MVMSFYKVTVYNISENSSSVGAVVVVAITISS